MLENNVNVEVGTVKLEVIDGKPCMVACIEINTSKDGKTIKPVIVRGESDKGTWRRLDLLAGKLYRSDTDLFADGIKWAVSIDAVRFPDSQGVTVVNNLPAEMKIEV